MPRIQLLLLLKSFLVSVGNSQIRLPTVNASELPIQYLNPGQTHVFKESIPLIYVRDDIIEKDYVQLDHLHNLIFVVRHKNMDQIEAILNDISNASSQNYRRHLSKEQIVNLTSNKESRAAVVSYLLSFGAAVSTEVQSWEYITATAPVGLWESFFQSTFYKYYQLQHDGSKKEFIRANEYWLPMEMNDHIESVFNIIQLPHRLSSKVRGLTNTLCPSSKSFDTDMSSEERSSAQSNFAKIRDFYGIGSIKGNTLSFQGIFAVDHQCEGFDNLDSSHQISKYIFNKIEESSTVEGPNDLLTYLNYNMASSPGSPTSLHCTNAHFSDWLVMMAEIDSLPLVISLAIDIPETYLSKSELDAFNILAIKLLCMGVTIIAPSGYYCSAGDAGLGQGTEDQMKYSFISSFPASNPYVTAVAISMGSQAMDDEVDSSGTQYPADTSTSPHGRGGLSPRHPQQPLLPSKLLEHSYTVHQIGGVYPDVILRAYHDIGHEDEGKGKDKGTDLGPSPYLASSLVAGFLSSINAAHIAAGKGSLGWLNPLLHSSSISLSEGVNEETLPPAEERSRRSSELGSVTFQTLRNILTLKDVDYTDSQQNIDDDEKQMLHLGNKGKRNGSRRSSNHSSSFPSLSLTYSPLQALSHSPYLKRGEGTMYPTKVSRQVSIKPTNQKYTDYTVAAVSQSFTGISVSDAKNESFLDALTESLRSESKMFITVKSLIASSSSSSSSSASRRLLLSTDVSYVLSANSTVTQIVIVPLLRSVLFSANYVTSLRNYSGFSNMNVSNIVITDLSPTAAPTSAPDTKAAITATIIIAVGGAFVGVVLLAIILCIIYCCCCRTGKHTNPEGQLVEIVEEPPLANVVLMPSNTDCPNSHFTGRECPVAVLSTTSWESSYSTYVLQDAEICDYNPQLYLNGSTAQHRTTQHA